MSRGGEPETFEPATGPAPAFDAEAIRARVQKYFRVYEVETNIRGVPGGEIAAYYVQTDPATFGATFEKLRDELREAEPHLLVIFQHKLGEDVILVARKPPVQERGNGLNILLLVLTILTTTLSGSFFYQAYEGAEDLLRIADVDASFLHPRLLGLGFLTFSLPLIVILGVHELGHYFVAKRHAVRTSLPYFIPVPPIVPIGTFGAFISIREPIPDRKALFDIGAAGPIAGFLVAIPVLVLGMVLTATFGVPVPPEEEVHATLFTPEGGFAFGSNGTKDLPPIPAEAMRFDQGNRTHDKKEFYFEELRIDLSALRSSLGIPNGTWNYTLQGFHLVEDRKVTLRIDFVAPEGSVDSGDFVREGGNYTLRLDRTLAETRPQLTYSLPVPANATHLVAGFETPKPPARYMELGDSLFFVGMEWAVGLALPLDGNVLTHPTGIAGWVGILVTGFNLLPAGQLDGGHVARAFLGDRMRWASYAAVGLMFVLSLRFAGWLVMAVLIVLLGLRHPPPLNDKTPLDGRRKILGVLVLIILIITFVPYPFRPA